MISRKKALTDKLALFGFGLGQKIFLTKDVLTAERRGAAFGDLTFRLMKSRRERTIANLALAFPEWTPEKRFEVARGVFRHFGMITADFMRTPLRTKEELLANMEIEGFEHFQAAEAVGTGIIACTAHLGNWERFGHWMVSTGRGISVVARDANQGKIQERVQEIREMTGLKVLSNGESPRPILTKLKKKEIVGILPDQNSDQLFVPFFGKLAGTVRGPALLHSRTGAVLLPTYCVRLGPGKYKVIVKEPIDIKNEIEGHDVLMAKLNLSLEEEIRKYPEQWLWMHDRWKFARRRNLLDAPFVPGSPISLGENPVEAPAASG